MTEVQATNDSVRLDNGRTVPHQVYRLIIDAVEQFHPLMLPEHSYSVETMVGQAIWRTALKWHAGAIVAYAVRQKQLPLEFADNGKRSTKLYQLVT
jgi:hypothetical protein